MAANSRLAIKIPVSSGELAHGDGRIKRGWTVFAFSVFVRVPGPARKVIYEKGTFLE